ncbi:hypothetical protein [Tautonia plasticadhaerens]|uniref:Uncharacterized protein n=1 Tax=Tautonia plasticadhaerens TaxID=2527974 RepID=A0A518GVL6_9BACT|nr:hypothetical protein [Tautonia plasticadhaerens]QDV32591.1 hypothetical protein ElP_04260 [Tautonia plasticadhaerens]
MRRAIPLAVVAAALVAAWFSSGLAQGGAPQASDEVVPSWEYRVLILSDVVDAQQALRQEGGQTATAFESRFDELGRDDWESCGDLPGVAIFKQPGR